MITLLTLHTQPCASLGQHVIKQVGRWRACIHQFIMFENQVIRDTSHFIPILLATRSHPQIYQLATLRMLELKLCHYFACLNYKLHLRECREINTC